MAQCDLWFPSADIPLGAGQRGRPPMLVMVLGSSRWILAQMVPSREAGDLIAGMWALLAGLGGMSPDEYEEAYSTRDGPSEIDNIDPGLTRAR